jgi:hypothetical protein
MDTEVVAEIQKLHKLIDERMGDMLVVLRQMNAQLNNMNK